MFRSFALTTAMLFVVAAPAQVSFITRTDSLSDSTQLTFGSGTRSISSPSTAWLVFPTQSDPSYNYGYAITGPTAGAQRPVVTNDLLNRNVFRAHNLFMSYNATANGHTFRLPNDSPFGLFGPVQFFARYNATGLFQRDVVFSAAPTAQMSGPTANLSARLSSTRIGQFNLPRYIVTGYFLNASGVNNVNLITPVGGITFNTFLAPSAATFSMPIARLTVPSNRLTTPPRSVTSTEFRANYELRLR
jgi:hypothetical protein